MVEDIISYLIILITGILTFITLDEEFTKKYIQILKKKKSFKELFKIGLGVALGSAAITGLLYYNINIMKNMILYDFQASPSLFIIFYIIFLILVGFTIGVSIFLMKILFIFIHFYYKFEL